jgi:hypothetical protein
MSLRTSFVGIVAGLLIGSTSPASAAAILVGPSPYLSAADIPAGFFAAAPTVETFEDGTLDFGIVASGVSHFILGPSGITDSVDADDGAIDGSGSLGHSYVGNGVPGVTFTFSGPLPTAAALVWTDGFGATFPTTFQAFGPGMVLLGTIVAGLGIDGNWGGATAEDSFFGVKDPGGILAIQIISPGGQVEADHVMFGPGSIDAPPVPEPTTLGLLGVGLLIALRRRLRR